MVARPLGLFVDVDGTIAEIAPTPQDARVTSASRQALERLSQTLDAVVVLTGRPAEEAHRMVGVDGLAYIGNHGLELWEGGQVRVWKRAEPYTPVIKALVERLRPWLQLPGVFLEEKGIALAIHYRGSSDPSSALRGIRRILEEAEVVHRFDVQEGRRVVEVRPPLTMNKGVALREFILQRELQGALVLGDDRADVEGFKALRTLRRQERIQGLCGAVVSGEAPPELIQEADFTLSGVGEVEWFLKWLASSGT